MNSFNKFFLVLLVTISGYANAQNLPEPMSPPCLVNDFAGIFNEQERSDLEQMLIAYNDTTSTQIYVVTIKDLEGYDISDYAFRLSEKWGVGQEGKNNGATILIKPKIGNERGRVFIATGYGLEEKLNDAKVGRIIDNEMLPHFQRNDYYTGTKNAIGAMISHLSGQFQADKTVNEISTGLIITIIGIVLFFLSITISAFKKGNAEKRSRGRGGFGGSSRSSSSRSSSSRSSSSRSGGFRGGGGGRSGGGGAGRSW